jgi:hypothetical protein
MDVTEKIQALIAHRSELIAEIELSMSSVPEEQKDSQMFALDQLKSELAGLKVMLSEQPL